MKDEHTAVYFCTGVFATADEIARMKDEYSMPIARIGGTWPTPERTTHELAIKHGLPEIRGFYGCDFRDGEFIREMDADKGAADTWGPYPPDDIRNQRAQ